MKPLSFRLLNEQTPVAFVLKDIVDSPSDQFPLVTVEELNYPKAGEYMGNVQILEGAEKGSFKDYAKKVKAYKDYMALPKEKQKDPAPQVIVEISRASHEEFPYMR